MLSYIQSTLPFRQSKIVLCEKECFLTSSLLCPFASLILLFDVLDFDKKYFKMNIFIIIQYP